MRDRYFSDEELVAYLDGEADFAPADEIALALEGNLALQRRVAALEIDRDALQREFDALVPDRGMGLPDTPGQMRRVWRGGAWRGGAWRFGSVAGLLTAAVATALAIGFALGASQSPKLRGWADYVAAYQALYSNSTLAHIETTPEVQQQELDRVAASIGKRIDVSELSIFPDVTYRRAQILSFGGQALIQMAFLNSTGEPVALCVIRASSEGADQMLQIARMEGLSTALWAQNGYDYVLIGGTDDALIERMAAGFIGMKI